MCNSKFPAFRRLACTIGKRQLAVNVEKSATKTEIFQKMKDAYKIQIETQMYVSLFVMRDMCIRHNCQVEQIGPGLFDISTDNFINLFWLGVTLKHYLI